MSGRFFVERELSNDDMSVSHGATVALMVSVLIVAFLVGVACVVFSVNMIKHLQTAEEDDPLLALGRPSSALSSSINERPNRVSEIFDDLEERKMDQDSRQTGGWGYWDFIRPYGQYLKLW